MSVLIIRAHKRFAVCHRVGLRKPGRRGVDGLLIELSLEGCRISGVDPRGNFELDEPVVVSIDGAEPLEARIRWQRDGTEGLRFQRPLSMAALERLIRLCRGEMAGPSPQRAFGT